jgi:hypothetical protein
MVNDQHGDSCSSILYYGPRSQRENHKLALEAKRDMVQKIATFLRWPQTECRDCFLNWKDSTKDHTQTFSPDEISLLRQHEQRLEGVWSPVESRRQNLNICHRISSAKLLKQMKLNENACLQWSNCV